MNNPMEEGRRLASQREDLIAQGVDPAELLTPLAPQDPYGIGAMTEQDLDEFRTWVEQGWPPQRKPRCCDLHNRNCEPPSELCCSACTEAVHPDHWRDGTECIAPDLSKEDQ